MENQNLVYVSVLWSDYQALRSTTHSRLYHSAAEANQNCTSNQDALLGFADRKDAEAYLQAFKNLCQAAWTPNQTDDEKEEDGRIIAESQKIMDDLDKKIVENLNPWEE
jgi:hypothetical protein